MTKPSEDTANTQKIKEEIHEALGGDGDIRERVRNITVDALKERHLDSDSIKKVIHTVLESASTGTASQGTRAKETISESVSGVEEALLGVAEASKLAIEEAIGRTGDFTSQEMQRSLDDLKTLEELFINTISEVSGTAKERAGDILSDLAEHARRGGTTVGEHAMDAMTTLGNQLQREGRAGLHASKEAALSTGTKIAEIASGFLQGIADSLQASKK